MNTFFVYSIRTAGLKWARGRYLKLLAWQLIVGMLVLSGCQTTVPKTESAPEQPPKTESPKAEAPKVELPKSAAPGVDSAPPPLTQPAPPPTDVTRFPAAKNGKAAHKDYVEVEVFYATDRAATGRPEPAKFYGTQRGNLQYGTATVSIPKGKTHKTGELESPVWWKFEFREDPTKHIVLMSLTQMQNAAFYRKLQDASAARDLFVFVHGFNVTFEDAVRRTAQIAYDLPFPGVPVTYSWPSQGSPKPFGYTADEATVEWTERHLKAFLKDLQARSGAQHIHLLAHSMGNRALTKVLRSIASEQPSPLFSQVILAAPDIDADVFERDIAPAMLRAANRFTLYASSDDQALAASKEVHGYPRAGQSGESLIVLSGLDTIDASGIDTSLLGHSYFAEQTSLVTDIFMLLRHGTPPNARQLSPRQKNGIPYWSIAP